MLGSLTGLITDVAKIAVAPIEIAIDTTRAVTKPIADAAQEASKEVKKSLQECESK